MELPLRVLMRRLAVAVFILLVVVTVSFLLPRLGAGSAEIMLGGPNPGEERVLLVEEHGLNRPAIVQFLRYLIRTLGLTLGRSWFDGESVGAELLARFPATLELMLYALVLAALIAVPTGVAAAFARGTAEDRAVRGAAILGEATPPVLLGLVLILVFFRWLEIAPPPSGRISIVLTPPSFITGSYVIDAVLRQDSIAMRSALAQLVLPVVTLTLVAAASLTLLVRGAMLAQMDAPHFAYARAQGMPREMLTAMALRGAAPSIGAGVATQAAAFLGVTALVEFVFSWGGISQYGLEAMARADFAPVQGFILLSAAFAAAIHLLRAGLRRLARIRLRRA